MTNTIRKRLGPMSVVATIAVLGVLAAFIALAAMPETASAQPAPPGGGPGSGGGTTPTPPPGGPPAPPALPPSAGANQVGGPADSYVIEGPGFVDQQADQVSDYVIVVTDEDGNAPDYDAHGGNMVRVRFTRHDAVPSIDEAGDIVVGCLPDDARLTSTNLQGMLTASLQSGVPGDQCSITLDLSTGSDMFTIMATSVPNNTRLGMSVTVVGGSLVDTHTVTFLNPGVPTPPPTPDPVRDTADPDCYSVSSSDDVGYDDSPNPGVAQVNAERGQTTVQVLDNSDSTVLTVTSCHEGPVYLRFIDRYGAPFSRDVDECPDCPSAAGASIVGLDGQDRLALNLMRNLSAADALMYDQYQVRTITTGSVVNTQLIGRAGNYYQGKFRFYDPCHWEPFQVHVYDKDYKTRVATETIHCTPAAIADPTEFSVEVHTAVHGRATVRWAEIPGSIRYHVAAIDTTNPAMWTVDPAHYSVVERSADRMVQFNGLTSGTTYLFVAIGEQANGTYSIPRSLLQTTVYQ